MKCKVCDADDLKILYTGKIRKGKFPNFIEDGVIYVCSVCKVQMFDGKQVNYETEEYRELVDSSSSPEAFYRMHDSEQSSRLSFFDISKFRGATFADVGAGAGSFLDLVKGYSGRTIAIEPGAYYHKALVEKGHEAYSYMQDALKENKGKCDVVTCFSVLEHIDDPVTFASELCAMCKPGGTIILSTPNSEDWLIDYLPSSYKPFFYRVVHKWYFNAASLLELGKRAGLNEVEIRHKQRFNLTNALNWVRDERPTGHSNSFFSELFESHYQMEVEAKGKSDYIYMIAKK